MTLSLLGSTAMICQGCPGSIIKRSSPLPQNSVPSAIRIRYDVNDPQDLAKRNVDFFRVAVKEMKKRSKNDPKSNTGWFAQAFIHHQFCSGLKGMKSVHATGIFLPWHRAYLVYFEEMCRQILKELSLPDYDDFALPYWNWAEHPLPDVFWDEAKNYWDEDLNSIQGPDFWNLQDDVRKDWQRKNIRKIVCREVNQTVVDTLLQFDFNVLFGLDLFGRYTPGQLETTVHNTIHQFIGGNMFYPPTAALDPIFWLHHANVDRLWEIWMKNKETMGMPLPKCSDPNIKFCHNCAALSNQETQGKCLKRVTQIRSWLDTEIDQFPISVGKKDKLKVCELLNTLEFGYQYSDLKAIQFGDCINIKTINEEKNLIDITIEKKIMVNNSASIKIAEFLNQKKNQQNLKHIEESIAAIFSSKLNSAPATSSPVLLMRLELEKPLDPAISTRVFLNPPENPLELSTESSSYVATFSFFETKGGHQDHMEMTGNDKNRTFIFDLTNVILKLDSFDLKNAIVAFCPKVLNGGNENNQGNLVLLNIQLLVAQ